VYCQYKQENQQLKPTKKVKMEEKLSSQGALTDHIYTLVL
jgi:hypothetical protein